MPSEITQLDAAPDEPCASRAWVLLLLAVGAYLWFSVRGLDYSLPARYVAVAIQVAVVSLPPINRWLARALDRLRQPSPRRRLITAVTIGVLSTLYLGWSAWEQGRDFFPKFHDESMHLVEARIMAGGRLWLPAHPLPQFFETFHLFVTPVYAAMQFPGTSMLYVPGFWLHLPYWATPLVIAGVTLALLYLVVTELIDGVAGLLAAAMLLGTTAFRYLSFMAVSNPPALMLGLATACAYLRWRRSRGGGGGGATALLIGACAGWAAITRPPEAVCFALPVGLAMALDLRGRSGGRWAAAGLALVVGATPFLAIQLTYDRGVTGQWLTTPHERYVELFHPGATYGFASHLPAVRPHTQLRQKLDYYEQFMVPGFTSYRPSTAVRAWLDERLPAVAKVSLPSFLALLLVPPGLLGTAARGRRRWLIIGSLPLFVAFYALSTHFDPQYALITAPAMITLAILGARACAAAVPTRAWRLEPVLVIFLFALAFTGLPQTNPAADEQSVERTLSAVQRAVATIPGRAVVFFRYRYGDNVHEEPVYNVDVANVDDARVVRAQDLGPLQNIKLYDYYRQRQPDRAFYRFDRHARTLTRIDPKAEYDAAAAMAATRPSGL